MLLLSGCAHNPPPPAGSPGQTGTPGDPGQTGGPQAQPSQRFDGVDFKRATVSRDDQGNIAVKLVVGVDVVGNLRIDQGGMVTYEQHPVVIKSPPAPQPLSPEDRASLAANLQRFLDQAGPNADPLWQQVQLAAKK